MATAVRVAWEKDVDTYRKARAKTAEKQKRIERMRKRRFVMMVRALAAGTRRWESMKDTYRMCEVQGDDLRTQC